MNTIVEAINAAGRAFVDFSLPMLIQSSVLILILLAVDIILRRRVRAVFRYWIWMLVLVKLVLPPSLGSPISVGAWLGDKLEVPTASLVEPEPVPVPDLESQGQEPSPIVSDIIAPSDPMIAQPSVLPPAPMPALPEMQQAAISLNWQGFLLLAWSAVAIALTLLLVQRAFFVRGLVAQAQDANRGLLDELENCCRRLSLHRRIGLRLSPNATSPAVCGLLHPMILIPQSLAPRLHGYDLQAVFLHELAHVKRGDLWINLAQTLLQIVYFYNPLLWLANTMIRRTREQAVDEAVLVAMGETARQYPEILVNIAKLAFTRRPALSLRLIGVVESKSALTARIKHILNRPIPKTARLGITGLAVIALVAVILLPMAAGRSTVGRPDGSGEQQSAFVETLPNGAVVELLGVCEYPSEGRQWWRPDGSRMERAPYKTTGNERQQEAGFKDYELVVRYTGAPDMSIEWDVPGSRNSGITGSPLGEDDRRIWDLTVNTVRFPEDQASTTVRVATAAGPWETRAVHKALDREGAYNLDDDKVVTFGIAHIQEGRLLVPVTVNLSSHDRASRVVAVRGWDGECEGSVSGAGNNSVHSLTYRFNCSLSDVKEFRFQTRPWTWVEFEDVSLRPGQKADAGSAARARARVLGIGPAWEILSSSVGKRSGGTIGGFGRDEKQSTRYFEEMLDRARPGDALVLMLAFDRARVVPAQFHDLLLAPWSEIESRVQRGESVEIRGKARDLDVIVLAAATSEQLNALVRQTPLLDAYRVEASREITLPDVDQQAVMLDLATGQLVPTPQVEPAERIMEAIEELGKGDLVLDHQSLILVRGATSKQAQEAPEGLVKVIKIGSPLPQTVTVTTAEGRQYEIRVLSIDDKACRVSYSPMPADAIEMRAPVVGSAEREERIVLPDVDHEAVVLDLATGELVPLPPVGPEPQKTQQALRELGKGDILYGVDLGDRSLILLRGAVSEQVQEDTGEPGVKGHFVGDNLPEVLMVTTAEGRRYEVTILSADENKCTLKYSPISTAGGDSGDAPGDPATAVATTDAKPSDSGLVARLANGVTITLLAHARLGGAGLEWWTPQGERTTIPGVYEADVEGHGSVLALRAEPRPEAGIHAWLCQPPDVKQELKPVWCVGDSDIWLIPLGEGRNYVNVEIMAQVRDPVVVKALVREGFSLPDALHADPQGPARIIDVNRVDSDSTAFSASAGPDIAAVVAALDVSGQIHSLRRARGGDLEEISGLGLSQRRRYETDIPLDRFAGVVMEGYSERAGLMKLGNLSLRSGQPTRVRVEVEPEQRGPWWHPSGYDSKFDDLHRRLVAHATTHDGSYPANESTLRALCPDELWTWLQGHVVYLGAGKTSTAPAQTALAYVKTLLPFGFGADVLYSDGSVEFEVPSKLKELGIPVGGKSGRVGGTLEFRVAAKWGSLDSAAVERYQRALVNGNSPPEADFAWFPIRVSTTGSSEVLAQEHRGTAYVLLWNKPPHVILASQDWGLDEVHRTTDAVGRPAIGLTLNEKGASLFHDITAANVQQPLAILVDGKVVSMPHIASPLDGRSALIVGNFTEGEVADMMAALRPAQKTTSDAAMPPVPPQEISGRVVDPNGKPVVGAQVALCTKDKGAIVRSGRLVPTGRTDKSSEIVQTGAEGRFSFASAPEEFHLIAAHDAGFAWVTSEELRAAVDLRLEPWARIEGTLKIGQTPGADERVELFNYINKNAIDQNVRFDYQSQTDAAGRFAFTKVPPTWMEVGYLIQTGDPASSYTCRTPIHLEPGQNMQMTLGGQGRPVIGKFVPPADYKGSVYFGAGLRAFSTSRPERPKPDNYDQMTQREQAEWLKQWLKTPEARTYYDAIWYDLNRRHYAFRIQDDGRFRIEDVMPGNYEFTVWLEEQFTGQGRQEEIGGYYGKVEVPAMTQAYTDEPLDLGDLTLSMRNPPLRVGDVAPLFEAKTLDGRDIRLADSRGKFVLLSFWQPVFHPELDRLKELCKTYGTDGRLAIIEFAGNDTLEEVKKYIAEHGIEWPEVYLGEKGGSDIAKRYGDPVASYILLIDPEGKIVATWLREEKLTNTVRDIIAASVSTSPSSIQQRIDAAAPGDTVRLEPGTYQERLRIDKPLTLEGAGWDKTTVVMESRIPESKEQAADLAALSVLAVVGTRDVTIRGIKFTSPGRRVEGRSLPIAIVSLSQCETRLSDCAVIGGPGDGVHILDQSNVAIQRCLVAAVWGTGIRVGSKKDTVEARIEDSDIRNCHYAGICISWGNKAAIERCRVSGAAWHGIRYDDASPLIAGNLIFGSARSGIYASGQTQATIKGNLFYANEMGGMSCWFQDKDLIEGNTFSDNKGPGLAILGASKPSVRSNIFYGHPAGVSIGDIGDDSPFAKSDGAASLENNLFWANERAIQRTSDTGAAQAVTLDEKAGVAIDPRFAALDAKDFSLKADSPARQKGVGAADLIPFASPWPLQPEELAIIPQGDTRDSRQWRDPPLP